MAKNTKKPAPKPKKTTQKTSKKPTKSTVKARGKALTLPVFKEAPAQRKEKPKKKENNRNQDRDQETSPDQITILERQDLVLDLKKNGATIRQISNHLKAKGYEASIGTVQTDLRNALADLQESKTLNTKQWVEYELQINMAMWFAVYPRFINEPKSFSVFEYVAMGAYIQSLQDRRDKYLGFSKQSKSETDVRDAFAKLLGVPKEKIPEPQGKK